MRMNKLLPPVVALAASLAFMASADTLVQRGDGWNLGEVSLTSPFAQRALVASHGSDDTFRFDGNSNWLEAESGVSLDPSRGIAAGAWLALASPPGDTAAIVYLAEDGFLLGLNRWRQPEIRLGGLRVAGNDPLPVGEWVHVAGDYDGETLRLRVDGEEVAQANGDFTDAVEGLFAIGRAPDAGFQQGTHPLGVINGLMSQVTFRQTDDPVTPGQSPPSPPDLDTPESWFSDDPDRPRTFTLGATGWANEPHALTWRNGMWHVYFQANPNGAFWRDIVWGHQTSADLAEWTRQKPALMPTTGFDRRGVWVGNWIPDYDTPAVVYTGVNGEWAGIGLATANEHGSLNLVQVVEHDTPSEFQDMRDPWVVRTDDGWLMLIGTGSADHTEALVYSYRSDDGETWKRAGLFDTGGTEMPGQYWELPVLLEMGDTWMLMGTPVVEGVPARTLYWLGAFDGTRFVPDDPEPRQLDILATYRAPTLARGPEGDLIAIGIIADEIRNEQQRHESGWVHVLTPATKLALCGTELRTLCQAFAQPFADRFSQTIDEGNDTTQVSFSTDGQPTLMRAEIDASGGGLVRVAVRVAADGEPSVELTIDAGTGIVQLDYSRGATKPLGRPSIIRGRIDSSDTIKLELLIDGAAVFGTINGRPLAFLAFAIAEDRNELKLLAENGASISMYHFAGEE